MDLIVGSILFIGFLIAIVILIVGILIYNNDPDSRRERALHKQATIDYEHARGSQHLNMLIQAKNRWTKIEDNCKRLVSISEYDLSKLKQSRHNALAEIIETTIFERYITEIPGIGDKLKGQLKTKVFRKQLSDLRSASALINGIGDNRQDLINNWIRSWENKIPILIEEQFYGKDKIEKQFQPKILEKNKEIQKLKNELITVQTKISRINKHISTLNDITVNDFKNAIVDHDHKNEKLDAYSQGLFPEWEPIPDWFIELIS